MRWATATIIFGAVILGASFFSRPVEFFFPDTTSSVVDLITTTYRTLTFQKDAVSHQTTTILLLGKAGAGWTAGELTDTIVVAQLSGPLRSAMLLSLPRDLLIQSGNYQGKINALWQIGKQAHRSGNIEEQSQYIVEVVEDITGLTIDETLIVDVSAVEQIVDSLGGISINVQEEITDTRYPTLGGGIETFHIKEGFQILDGATAVKYARTRHTREGDFGRIRRQHQVVEAIVSKTRGLKLTEDLSTVIRLLDTLGDHVATSFSLDDITRLTLLARTIPFSNVKTFALETLMARARDGSTPLLMGAGFASGLIPTKGFYAYSDIHEAIQDLLK